MEFHRPFDSRQRQAANQRYRQLRKYLRTIRTKFPPKTDAEAKLFRRYHDLGQDFARELLTGDDNIDVRRLNTLAAEASNAAVQYNVLCAMRELYGTD